MQKRSPPPSTPLSKAVWEGQMGRDQSVTVSPGGGEGRACWSGQETQWEIMSWDLPLALHLLSPGQGGMVITTARILSMGCEWTQILA